MEHRHWHSLNLIGKGSLRPNVLKSWLLPLQPDSWIPHAVPWAGAISIYCFVPSFYPHLSAFLFSSFCGQRIVLFWLGI